MDAIIETRRTRTIRVFAQLSNGKTLAIRLSPYATNPSLWKIAIGHRKLVAATETIFDLQRLVDECSLHGVDLGTVARANWLKGLLFELKQVGLSAMMVKGVVVPFPDARRGEISVVHMATGNGRDWEVIHTSWSGNAIELLGSYPSETLAHSVAERIAKREAIRYRKPQSNGEKSS